MGRFFESKLTEQFSDVLNEKQVKTMLRDNYDLISLYNQAFNALPALHRAIVSALNSKPSAKQRRLLSKLSEYYKDEMGRELMDITKDLEALRSKYERLQRKYKSWLPEKGKESKDKFNFNRLIFSVSMILEVQIDRSLKLYQFVPYWERAMKISRKRGRD